MAASSFGLQFLIFQNTQKEIEGNDFVLIFNAVQCKFASSSVSSEKHLLVFANYHFHCSCFIIHTNKLGRLSLLQKYTCHLGNGAFKIRGTGLKVLPVKVIRIALGIMIFFLSEMTLPSLHP